MSTPVAPSSLVLLDATAISAQRGGVGRYVEALAAEAARAEVPLVVVCQRRDAFAFAALHADTVVAPNWVSSVPLRFVWEQVGLPLVARRVGADVIHSPHYTFPLVTGRHRVVTVHDLTFWSHPERHSAIKRAFFRFWITLGARFRVDAIVPSQATADEYVRVVGAQPNRVTVAYHGVDSDSFRPPTRGDIAGFRDVVGADEWIAFLGTIEPRKNIVPLIEGYRLATAASRRRPALLLAGAPGWDSDVQTAIEAAVAVGFDVRHLGYVPLVDLPAFLGGAKIVAYPSEGEGFGLPVLEAMACGTAVLTAPSLAIPEVGGDAVAYTATDAASIGRELTRLLADDGERRRLSRAGVTRAAEFTWERCLAVHRAVWSLNSTGR